MKVIKKEYSDGSVKWIAEVWKGHKGINTRFVRYCDTKKEAGSELKKMRRDLDDGKSILRSNLPGALSGLRTAAEIEKVEEPKAAPAAIEKKTRTSVTRRNRGEMAADDAVDAYLSPLLRERTERQINLTKVAVRRMVARGRKPSEEMVHIASDFALEALEKEEQE
jgi:hypothetical protein